MWKNLARIYFYQNGSFRRKKLSKPKTVTSATMSLGNEVISREISAEKFPSANNKTQTISNSEWTITTDAHDSWTGVNNTGNISCKVCDVKG
jgi:hypothetical protein